MKLIKKRNYNPVFPSFFDDVFTRDFFQRDFNPSTLSSTPKVNISENDESYKIEVAVPGLKKEDFNLELENDLLTVSFENKQESSEEDDRYTRREFSYTSFSRSFTLPEGKVNVDEVGAGYEDGILTLTLPKLEEVKTKSKRTIEIG